MPRWEPNPGLKCFFRMIEAVMYMLMGFLGGCLLALAVLPRVHDRAVRLTMRRLEGALPMSVAEIETERDLLRAEFAMSARRLELNIEQLNSKRTDLLVKLAKKNEVVNQVRAERDALKDQVEWLKLQAQAQKKQISGTDTRPDAEPHVVRRMIPRKILHAAQR